VVVCLRLPDVPVTVTVTVPRGALLLAVNVSVLVDVAGSGLNDAVTPLGSREAESDTLPVKPPDGAIVIAVLTEDPRETDTLFGEADSVKSPPTAAAFTVRVTDVACVRLPDVPVTVTVEVPVAAVAVTVNVKVLVPVVGFWLNAAVTPLGKPEADSVTLPVNPFERDTVIVLVPALPCVIVTLPGEADSPKFGAALTVRETEVVCVRLPDVPVTVTVAVPSAAVLLAFNVNVLVPVVGLVLKAAVTPLGSPEADNVTLPVKPLDGVTVTVLVPLAPCAIVRLLGEADREKLGAGPDTGQLFTRLATLTVPMPVAKSQPTVVP
jgi:hypothetical protein